MASAERLNRILGMIPYLLQNQGVNLKELADEFQVRPSDLVRDLEALSNCSYGPFGSAEIMDAYIDGEQVHIWAGEHFKRPLSFTPGELMALRTAVSLMLEQVDGKETRALARAYKRITEELEVPAPQPAALKGKIGMEPPPAMEADVFSRVERGVHEGRKLAISYFTEQRGSVSERTVRPYRMVCSDGTWYLVGWCERAGGVRTFRMDHVRSARILGEHFEVPEDFKLEDHFTVGIYVETEEDQQIVVRYLPPAARWVMEEEGRGKPDRDGTLTLTYRTSSPRWLLQRVLSYGEMAEILEPESVRRRLASQLADMAEQFKD